MNNHIIINKKQLFRCREVQRFFYTATPDLRGKRATVAGLTHKDFWHVPEHAWRHNPHRAVEALLEEGVGRCPAFVEEAVKDRPRNARPYILTAFPTVLLEVRAEVGLAEPENPEVSLVFEAML